MRTVGEHTEHHGAVIKALGDAIADQILEDVRNGDLEITDEVFIEFLPVIMADGNILFLRVIANECFEKEENVELINVFLDYVEVLLKKGERSLKKKMEAKNG